MKNYKRGFSSILVVLVVLAFLIACGSIYYIQHKYVSTLMNAKISYAPVSSTPISSTTQTLFPEDGTHDAYIVKAYEKESKKYIDVDYFITLRGKDAALRSFNDTKSGCLSGSPDLLKIKPALISKINSFSDNYSEFQDQFYKLMDQYNFNCFPNGIGMDVNDNPKIRTFEVSLKNSIEVHEPIPGYGPTEKIIEKDGSTYRYNISWSTFENLVSGITINGSDVQFSTNFQPPFSIVVLENKVIEMKALFGPAS